MTKQVGATAALCRRTPNIGHTHHCEGQGMWPPPAAHVPHSSALVKPAQQSSQAASGVGHLGVILADAGAQSKATDPLPPGPAPPRAQVASDQVVPRAQAQRSSNSSIATTQQRGVGLRRAGGCGTAMLAVARRQHPRFCRGAGQPEHDSERIALLGSALPGRTTSTDLGSNRPTIRRVTADLCRYRPGLAAAGQADDLARIASQLRLGRHR